MVCAGNGYLHHYSGNTTVMIHTAGKAVLLIILLSCFNTIRAQTGNEFWTRLQVNKKLNEQFTIAMDLQHRRHNHPSKSGNPFEEPLLNSIRLWLYYKPSTPLQIIFSPLAYFEHFDSLSSKEIRTTAGGAMMGNWGKLEINNRLLYELSFFRQEEHDRFIRHRLRLQGNFNFPIFKISSKTALSYNLSNEIFFRIRESTPGFNHDRLYNGIKIKTGHLELNTGYQLSISLPGNQAVTKNQFIVNMGVNI